MHYRLLHPTKYLGAHDLGEKDFTLTIKSIVREDLVMEGGRRENKPIVYFEKANKGLVLNKTNAKTIASMYGKDTDGWIGKAVTLFATTCRSGGGEETECIRIRTEKKPSRAAIE